MRWHGAWVRSGNTSRKYPHILPNVKRIWRKSPTIQKRQGACLLKLLRNSIYTEAKILALETSGDELVDIWFISRPHSSGFEEVLQAITKSPPIAGEGMARSHIGRYWATESSATTKSSLGALKSPSTPKSLEENRLTYLIRIRSLYFMNSGEILFLRTLKTGWGKKRSVLKKSTETRSPTLFLSRSRLKNQKRRRPRIYHIGLANRELRCSRMGKGCPTSQKTCGVGGWWWWGPDSSSRKVGASSVVL